MNGSIPSQTLNNPFLSSGSVGVWYLLYRWLVVWKWGAWWHEEGRQSRHSTIDSSLLIVHTEYVLRVAFAKSERAEKRKWPEKKYQTSPGVEILISLDSCIMPAPEKQSKSSTRYTNSTAARSVRTGVIGISTRADSGWLGEGSSSKERGWNRFCFVFKGLVKTQISNL